MPYIHVEYVIDYRIMAIFAVPAKYSYAFLYVEGYYTHDLEFLRSIPDAEAIWSMN